MRKVNFKGYFYLNFISLTFKAYNHVVFCYGNSESRLTAVTMSSNWILKFSILWLLLFINKQTIIWWMNLTLYLIFLVNSVFLLLPWEFLLLTKILHTFSLTALDYRTPWKGCFNMFNQGKIYDKDKHWPIFTYSKRSFYITHCCYLVQVWTCTNF